MTSKKVIRKSIIIGILFLIVYNAPFLHNRYKPLKKWSTYTKYYKKHNEILKKYIVLSESTLSDLKNKEITLEQFIATSEINAINKKAELKEYFKGKKLLKKEYSVMGYSSFRIFIYEVGFKIFTLFTSILLLIFVINPTILKEYKRFYLMAITGLIYVSTYWLLHSLLTRTDFKQWTYGASIWLLSIAAVALILIFAFLFTKKEESLKLKIRELIGFITFSREHVVKKLAVEVSDNSKVDKIIDLHEDKMWDTLEKVAD